MVQRLLIIGARQHAKVIVSLVQEFYSSNWEIAGYLDDNPALAGKEVLGYRVIGKISDLETVVSQLNISGVAIGISNRYMDVRDILHKRIKNLQLKLPTVVHERAYVSKYAEVGEAVVLNSGVMVNAFSKIGDNTVVYSNSTIEHETRLSDNVYIGPGVNFSSNVRVGKNTFIGAGAQIIPDIKIGTNVVVGAGSVVIHDVPDNVTIAGVPARVVNDRAKTVI